MLIGCGVLSRLRGLAKTGDGCWIVIECNDAQESGYAAISPHLLWREILDRIARKLCLHRPRRPSAGLCKGPMPPADFRDGSKKSRKAPRISATAGKSPACLRGFPRDDFKVPQGSADFRNTISEFFKAPRTSATRFRSFSRLRGHPRHDSGVFQGAADFRGPILEFFEASRISGVRFWSFSRCRGFPRRSFAARNSLADFSGGSLDYCGRRRISAT